MRLNLGAVLVLGMALTGIVFGQAKQDAGAQYAQPKSDNVGIYKNEVRQLNETPAFKVGKDDRLQVLETKRDRLRVSFDGQTGWVDKSLIVTTGKSKTFVFDNTSVLGYLDNPTAVYIMDGTGPEMDAIKLDRSFGDALKDNIDKETVDQQSGQ